MCASLTISESLGKSTLSTLGSSAHHSPDLRFMHHDVTMDYGLHVFFPMESPLPPSTIIRPPRHHKIHPKGTHCVCQITVIQNTAHYITRSPLWALLGELLVSVSDMYFWETGLHLFCRHWDIYLCLIIKKHGPALHAHVCQGYRCTLHMFCAQGSLLASSSFPFPSLTFFESHFHLHLFYPMACNFFFFLVGLRYFKLRTSCLQIRHSTVWDTFPIHFALITF
jgi:hypothetical protein